MEIEAVEISKLVLDPQNERLHSKENLKDIANSLRLFGQQTPIVVQQDTNIVLKGNGTLLAAKELGWKDIQVRWTDLSDQKAKAYKIADNRSAEKAKWDTDLLSKSLKNLKDDFSLDELGFDDSWLKVEPVQGQIGDDEIPQQFETRCKPGDLWLLGDHRLLCGDSTDILQVERLMGGEKANLWITDPPYGVSYKSNGAEDKHKKIENDDKPLDEMQIFWQDVCSNALIVCSDESPYYWFACQGGDQMMMMMMSISRAGWKVRHELIWAKDSIVMGRCDYHYQHEPIFYGWKQKGKHNWYSDRKQSSLLTFSRPKKSDLHPTMKPVELIQYLIGNSSLPKAIVLETFCGSGTTLIACEKTGRKCYGMEIDPHYCDVIIERWEKFTGKKATLKSGGGTGDDA